MQLIKSLFSFLLLLFIIVGNLSAQTQITGIVKNVETNEPVFGVSVAIKESRQGTITGEDGKYRLSLKHGKYTVVFSSIGYETIIKQAICNKSKLILNASLKPSAHKIDEIIITASKNKAIIKEIQQSPMAVSVIDGSAIRGRSAGLQEVLTRTSGIKVRQEGGLGSSSKISVHGLEGKRVAVFINGFSLNSPDGSFDINEIPVDFIKRIEVYKGIVPAEYGGDGLGGAINIVTREPDCDLVNVSLDYSNFNTFRSFSAVKKRFEKPGIQIGVALSYNRSDNNYKMDLTKINPDYTDNPYSSVTRNNDFFSSRTVIGHLLFNKLWFDEVVFEVAAYKNRKELQAITFDSREAHTYGTNTMYINKLEKRDFFLKGLDVKSSLVVPAINFNLVDTSRYIYDWDGTPTPSEGETTDGSYNLANNKQIEARHRFNANYRLSENHRLNLNNQYAWSKYTPSDEYGRLVDIELTDFPSISTTNITGLAHEYFGSNKRFQNSLILKAFYLNTHVFQTSERQTGSENEDNYTQAPPDSKVNNVYWGISEGISYEALNGLRFKLSASRNVRLPDASELFGDGIYIIASSELQPERSINANVGLLFDRYNFLGLHRLQFETNVFYTSITDMISVMPAHWRLQYVNLGEILIKGVDADLKIDWTERLYGYFNITWQDIRDNLKYTTDDKTVENPTYGKRVPNIPWFYFNTGLEYHRADWIGKGELSRIYCDLSYVYGFSYAWKETNRADQKHLWEIPSYYTLNFGFQQSFFGNELALNFEVSNLTDATVYNSYRLPLPGRTFRIKLLYNWFKDKSEEGAMGF